MAKTEMTWVHYQPCVDAKVCFDSSDYDGGSWDKGTRPVMNVSWDDIQIYITWLNQQTGKRYRLPSEAEWEYAARAGSTTKYSWGNSIDCSKAHYGRSICNSASTKPVASFDANAFGLYDMHGNLWEWTQDCWNNSYDGAPSDGSAWFSGNCAERILRGGSWGAKAVNLRLAIRPRNKAKSRNKHRGFRLVHDL